MYVKLFTRFWKNNSSLFRLCSLLLCSVVVFSCEREDRVLFSSEADNELKIVTHINTQVRATDAGFEIGDSIGLYVAKWQDATLPEALQEAGNYVDNALFSLFNLSNGWGTNEVIYYPNDDNKLDIYAYYPYRSPAFGAGCRIDLTVASNQTNYIDYTRSDFMVAKVKGVKRSPNQVQLTFNHLLAQMVFVLKAGTGFTVNDLKAAKVRVVNAVTDASYNLADTLLPVAGSLRHELIPCGSWEEEDGKLTGKKPL